jgi:hypothetical protein
VQVARELHPVAPARGLRRGFTAAELAADRGWTLELGAWIEPELERLARWAEEREDPEGEYAHGRVELPGLEALARRIHAGLVAERGVVRVVGLDPGLDDSLLRLVHLALGAGIGCVLETYGRLYDVVDRGADHRSERVPVSMTREATGLHTDSSALAVEPDHVGLLCLWPAASGGESRVSSALLAHERLRREAPEALRCLYRDFLRDLVTPGAERSSRNLLANRFPVFRHDPRRGLTMRYMRYWIERAHGDLGVPLAAVELEAFDRLDEVLDDPEHAHAFRLERGELLWVDNRTVAHDRTAYEPDPRRPRALVRMWTQARGADS